MKQKKQDRDGISRLEFIYKTIGTVTWAMIPDPRDRAATYGALLEEAIGAAPRDEREELALSVIRMIRKRFLEQDEPRPRAKRQPRAPTANGATGAEHPQAEA